MASGKKVAALSFAAILLVAMVVAVTVSVTRKNKEEGKEINSNAKAIMTVCEPTDHKDICVKTLNSVAGNITDPQELVKVAFTIAMKQIEEAKKNFPKVSEDLAKDPMTKKAIDQCGELSQLAINDLNRTLEQISNLDITRMDEMLASMKIWLSASLNYEETCLDGFENTTGDAGQKMKEYLKSAMELTENTLAMVTEVSSTLSGQGFKRRLLSTDGLPTWAGASARKLLAGSPKDIKPDLVIAKDGSGAFKTIKEAIDSIPKVRSKTFVVYIKEGVYEEKVTIPKDLTNLVIMGDGPTKTKITGNLNFYDGTPTFQTATFVVMAENFVARDIGFENTAGYEKHQAVAARISADFATFQNCRFDGYQDTLYTHTYRQFYRDCTITGTIDFIFGDSAAVFQNCNLLVRKCGPSQFNAVTAQGRKNPRMPTGIVLQNCTIKADPEFPPEAATKSYLGRPWKENSRTIIMESDIGDVIDPEGYIEWAGDYALNTLFYSEYNNRGSRKDKAMRKKWGGIHDIKKEVAEMFTPAKFLGGDSWVPVTKVPYSAGLIFPAPADVAGARGLDYSGEWMNDIKKENYVEKKN